MRHLPRDSTKTSNAFWITGRCWKRHKQETPIMQTIKIVVWEKDGAWLGFLQDYPDYWTQGKSRDKLRKNLKEFHMDISSVRFPAFGASRNWCCREAC